jgi:hypothetical protein
MADDWRDRWVTGSMRFDSWNDEVPVDALLRILGKPEVDPTRGPLSDAQVTEALTSVAQIVEQLGWNEVRLGDALRAFHIECEDYTRSVSL